MPRIEDVDWIKVSDRLPPSGLTVLVSYPERRTGRRCYVVGEYIAPYTQEVLHNTWEIEAVYNEDLDTYFLVEGWFEQQLNWGGEYPHIRICEGNVDYWKTITPPDAVPS